MTAVLLSSWHECGTLVDVPTGVMFVAQLPGVPPGLLADAGQMS
jgi:hypothetical protein